MSITKSRYQRMKVRTKRKRRIIGTTYGLGLLGVGIAASVMLFSIGHLYVTTKHWGDGQKGINMVMINPEYVSNYPTNQTKTLRQLSGQLTKTLHAVTVDTLPKETDEVLQQATELLKENQIESGQLVDDTNRLQLYQDLHQYMQNVYSHPDAKKLQGYMNQLQNMITAHDRKLDKNWMAKCQQVVTTYIAYNNTIQALSQYGSIKDGVYTIPLESSSMTPLIKQLEAVQGFPGVKSIIKQLKENEQKINQNQKQNHEQVAYYTFKALLKRIDGIYVQVSSVKTYQDVIKNGWSVEGTYLPDDKVEAILVDGQVLQPTDWLKLSVKPEIVMQEKVTMTTTETNEVKEEETNTNTDTQTSTERPQEETTTSTTTSDSTTTSTPKEE